MQVQLIATNDPHKGRVIPVDVPAFRIGQSPSCHLRSNSSRISQLHCVILTNDDTVAVLDLGSETGTHVNGEWITSQRELKNGDELIVGRYVFVVSIQAGVQHSRPIHNSAFELVSDSAVRPDRKDGQESETVFEIKFRGQDVFVTKGRLFEMARKGDLLPDDIIRIAGKKMFVDSIPGIIFGKGSSAITVAGNDRNRHYIKTFGSVLAILCLLGVLWVWLIPVLMAGNKNPYGAVRVVGTLTLDGKIIEGVSVILHPRDWNVGFVAGGMTDREGNFMVTTGESPLGSGAVPGEYDITFHKVEMEGAGLSAEEFRQTFGMQQPGKKYVIPQKYEDPKTSGLASIWIEPGGENRFNFDLSSVVEEPRGTVSRNSESSLQSSYRSPYPNIFEAARGGKVRDVEFFVRNGTNVNVKNNFGNTPLHFAARLNTNVEVVEYLVSLPGVEINARNRNGETPLDVTKSEESKRVLFDAGGLNGREL